MKLRGPITNDPDEAIRRSDLVPYTPETAYDPTSDRPASGRAISAAIKRSTAANPMAFGAVGDGVADDTAAVISAVQSGLSSVLIDRDYRVTQSLDISAVKQVLGTGKIVSNLATGVVVRAAGTATEIGTVTGTKGMSAISVVLSSAVTPSPGDIICIYQPDEGSFSAARPYYRDGEFGTVKNAGTGTIQLTHRLHSSYASADAAQNRSASKLYRIEPCKLQTNGLTIVSEGGATPFEIVFGLNNRIDTHCIGGANYSYSVDRCYGIEIGGSALCDGAVSGTQYGLVISNSQDVRVTGGQWYGTRHGITTGGGVGPCTVPCRDIEITGSNINSIDESNCLNFHGNTACVRVHGCDIINGVDLGGGSVYINNCTIRAKTSALYFVELIGGLYEISNCRILLDNNLKYNLLNMGASANHGLLPYTRGDITLHLTGCDIVCLETQQGANWYAVGIRNRGTLHAINVKITDNILRNDTRGTFMYMDKVSGNVISQYIIVDEPVLDSSTFTQLHLIQSGYATAIRSVNSAAPIITEGVGDSVNGYTPKDIATFTVPVTGLYHVTVFGEGISRGTIGIAKLPAIHTAANAGGTEVWKRVMRIAADPTTTNDVIALPPAIGRVSLTVGTTYYFHLGHRNEYSDQTCNWRMELTL